MIFYEIFEKFRGNLNLKKLIENFGSDFKLRATYKM